MRRERLPRKIIENDRIKKKQKNKKELVSYKLFERLLRLEKIYIREKNYTNGNLDFRIIWLWKIVYR